VAAPLDPWRFRGALVGLAAGDALGTTVEFRPPGSFEPLTGIVGGGPFGLPAGAWTDDTSMALCLAESLVERRGFDPVDQLRRYVRWYREGHLSSTGACFDIGVATRKALERFERTGEPYPGDADPEAAGNGPLMRLAPVALAYVRDPEAAVRFAADSARTTHGAPQAADACRYFAGLLTGALRGATKDELLDRGVYEPVPGIWTRAPLHPEVLAVAQGSFRAKEPPAIRGGGYVVHALEAALWAVARSPWYESAVLAAANLGDDADTTAAIAGQLAGALYGVQAIPAPWREKLAMSGRIVALADALLELARPIAIEDVPDPDGDWSAITGFALTFDGYAHFGPDWPSPYNAAATRFAESGELPGDVDDLRAILFIGFRQDRFSWDEATILRGPDADGVRYFDSDPDFDFETTFSRRYRRAIVARIRELLER
jgi:ADP-ribosyl-[dinitrogen reductase] hydrolase